MASTTPPPSTPPPVDSAYESQAMAVCISMLVLAAISVVLRFVVRFIKKTGLGWNDWLILPAFISYSIVVGLNLWVITVGGYGINPEFLDPDQLVVLGKSFYASPIVTVLTISFAKLSILALYYKIFVSDRFRWWVIVVEVSVIAWMIACFLATTLHCIPPAALWDYTITDGRCLNFILFFEIIEPINCAQDIIISLMPIAIIKRLQLDIKQKLGLVLIFLIGGFVAVISLIRIALIAPPDAPPDAIFTAQNWLVIQGAMAIICANMLTYRPLLPQRLSYRNLSSWFSSRHRSRPSQSGASTSNYQSDRNGGYSGHYNDISDERYAQDSTIPTNRSRHEDLYPLRGIKVERSIQIT